MRDDKSPPEKDQPDSLFIDHSALLNVYQQ